MLSTTAPGCDARLREHVEPHRHEHDLERLGPADGRGVVAGVAEPLGEVVERRDRGRLEPPLGPGRARHRHPSVRELDGPPDRTLGVAADPDRGPAGLGRAREHRVATGLEVPARDRDALAGPRGAHGRDRLVGEVVALVEVDAERGELAGQVARTHADDHPPARQRVERRDRLRRQERVAVGEDQQVRLQPDPASSRPRRSSGRRTGRGCDGPRSPATGRRASGGRSRTRRRTRRSPPRPTTRRSRPRPPARRAGRPGGWAAPATSSCVPSPLAGPARRRTPRRCARRSPRRPPDRGRAPPRARA